MVIGQSIVPVVSLVEVECRLEIVLLLLPLVEVNGVLEATQENVEPIFVVSNFFLTPYPGPSGTVY